MNQATAKKIGKILLSVLTYLFLALCILSVFITVLAKRDVDGAAEIFGYQMRIVTSNSMAASEHTDTSDFTIKSIPVGAMIFIKTLPDDPAAQAAFYDDLREGDVLTFRYVYTTQVTITHRITKITEKNTGGYLIELTGDNKDAEDGTLTQTIDTSVPNNPNYVIGKVTGQAYLFGLLLSFLSGPIGMIFVIILPCTVILFLEILKIVRALGQDKRQREEKERQEKENELQELRRRVAELESNQPTPDIQEEEQQ